MTTQAPTSFKINDVVLYKGWRYVFLGYVGKTGKMALIAKLRRNGDAYSERRVWLSSLTQDVTP